MKRKLAIFAAVALLLTGCSAISSGEITEKGHSDAYSLPVSYCSMYNAKGICTMWSVRYDYYPERWWFDLKLEDETGYVNVSEDTWGNYEVGDFYDKEG